MRRREFLTLFAGAIFPSELKRYLDPSTELEVLRLTDPAHTSILLRHVASRRGNFLLYASDRTGQFQVCRLDLKSGDSRQLTDAAILDPASIALLPNDSGFLYSDGDSLKLASLSGRTRDIAEMEDRKGALSVSDDGLYCSYVSGARVRLATLSTKPVVTTVVEAASVAAKIRPRRAQVLYVREDGSPWLVNFTGQGNRALKLDPVPAPEIPTVEWTPQGRTFAYLRATVLREHTPDENADRLVAKTSQYAAFGINGDASVFVGASGSKASPYVLLMLRVTRREFTLCEHRASNPSMVAPVFTPNSQSILFQSDRHGKPAIYRMRVEKLVESTDQEGVILEGK